MESVYLPKKAVKEAEEANMACTRRKGPHTTASGAGVHGVMERAGATLTFLQRQERDSGAEPPAAQAHQMWFVCLHFQSFTGLNQVQWTFLQANWMES